MNAEKLIQQIATSAKAAAGQLAQTNGQKRNQALTACAAAIRDSKADLQAANEKDLARALNDNLIGAAGIDVMEQEPINADNPMLKLFDKEKILITPHMAWASKESRELLVEKIARNIEVYMKAN